jgi:hypothetical protein
VLGYELPYNISFKVPTCDALTSLEDIEIGIDTIKHRSERLMRFAHPYRNLKKITKPNLEKILISNLFERLHQLMQPLFEQKKIELDVILKDPGISLTAGLSFLEQLLRRLSLRNMEGMCGAGNLSSFMKFDFVTLHIPHFVFL